MIGNAVSDPQRQKIQIRNNDPGGQAATVAGYAGSGFHTWPSGHIPQDTDPNPLLRIRSPTQQAFGEAFGESFGESFGAATGVSDPRLQKKHGPVLFSQKIRSTTKRRPKPQPGGPGNVVGMRLVTA